jgi:Cyclic nucleotide-binding domain
MVELPVSGTWSGLPKEIASELFAGATFYRLKAGDTLFQTGDTGDGCYRLDKGLLKVSLISPQVRERIIAILTPGAVVGDLARRVAKVRIGPCLDQLRASLSQPSCLRAPCSRAPRNPSISCEAFGCSVATRRRYHRILGLLAGESPRRPGPAYACGKSRGEDGRRCNPDPPHDQSRRHCRDGWSRPREYKSDLERVGAEEAGDQIVELLSDR